MPEIVKNIHLNRILILMLAMMAHAGCGVVSPGKLYESGFMGAESAENSGIVEKIEGDSTIFDRENLDAAGNSGFVGEGECEGQKQQELEAIKPKEYNMMEVYEDFLEGRLTVEWKGQQVYVSDLFWDNDIEYCYFDIDGDGSEELYIRDSVTYYGVKAQDEIPRVLLEGYTENQTENVLGWTGIRLQEFATWQEAYVDFIQKISITSIMSTDGRYSLIYIDSDDIPELYIYSGGMATGEILASFQDGNVRSMNRGRVGLQYMERGGLLYSDSGAMGYYPCDIYRLEQGEFLEIGTGWYDEYGDEQGNIHDDYYWEGSAVTEEEYEASIDKLIDRSKCVEPFVLYDKEEILEILLNGKDI